MIMSILRSKMRLVSVPIDTNTSQIPMPENSQRNELRVTAFWLFIAHKIGRLKFAGRKT